MKTGLSIILLDIGCFISYGLCHLVFAGVRSSQHFGLDIVDLRNLGIDLFRGEDNESSKEVKISSRDVLDPEPFKVRLDDRKVNIVYISRVLSQFDFEQSVSAAKNLISLTPGLTPW